MGNIRDNLKRNLGYYLTLRKISQKELADRLNVSQSSVTNWVKGKNSPDIETVAVICEILDISVVDLFGVNASTDLHLAPAAQRIGRAYEKATLPVQRTVEVALEPYMHDQEPAKTDNVVQFGDIVAGEEVGSKTKTIPVYDQLASAGTGIFLDSDQYTLQDVPLDEISAQANFCVRVRGDSMEPDFCDGDIVFVRQQPLVLSGQIGVFVIDGKVYIKRMLRSTKGVGHAMLASINPEYPPIEYNVKDTPRTLGLVLGLLNEI